MEIKELLQYSKSIKYCIFICSVPESILKTKFSKASQILLTALAGYAGDGGTSLLRSVSIVLWHPRQQIISSSLPKIIPLNW